MAYITGRGGKRIPVPADPEQRQSHIAAAVTLVGVLVGLGVIGLVLVHFAQAGAL